VGNFDVERWLDEHGLHVVRRTTWNGAQVWHLDPCPFEPEHCRTYNTAVFQFPSGALAFKCFGDRCAGKDWHALRELVEPGWDKRRREARLAHARDWAQAILDANPLDVQALYAPCVLDALVDLEKGDPGLFAQVWEHLKKKRITLRPFRAKLDESARERQSRQPTGTGPPRRVKDLLPGAPAPEDLVVPRAYGLTPTATVLHHQRGGDEIAAAPVLIVAILRDFEEETEAFRLAWRSPHGWRETTADRQQALNAPQMTGLAAHGFPVTSNTARRMVDYLAAFEAANPQLPVQRVSSHLGWQGKDGADGFLWGHTHLATEATPPIKFRGLAPGDEQLAAGFTSAGTLEDWLAAVGGLAPYPSAALALYTAFVPPLLSVLGAPNFIVDIANATSTGKTTAARISASVWGQPDEKLPDSVVQSWDNTKVWVERAASTLSDLPLFLDDTKRAKWPQHVSDTVYAVAQGRGKGRGNIFSMERVRSWRTVAISTGEAPATSFTRDGGARMRCLEVRGMPFNQKDDATCRLVDSLNIAVTRNHGHAGPGFVSWLIDHRENWPALRAAYEDLKETYSGRLATYFAAIHVAAYLVHDLFALPWDYKVVLDAVWPKIAAEAEDAAGAERALRLLVDWAIANQAKFWERGESDEEGDGRRAHDPIGGWAGRWDAGDKGWEYIGFFRQKLDEILTADGFEPEAILGGWRENGWLLVDADASRYTKKVRVGGRKHANLVCLRRDVIERIYGLVGEDTAHADAPG
jgi:hypothetical protein